jgi:VCPO second helical-bundle domain
MKTSVLLFLALTLSALAGGPVGQNALGPLYSTTSGNGHRHVPPKDAGAVRRWNQIAIDASGFDHAGAREQLGPGRASRAMAIVHIAMFDTVNAVVGGYESYADIRAPKGAISLYAAVSQAAHDTLIALFPAQKASFDAWLAEDLAGVKNNIARANGVTLGSRAAAAILALKANDGSEIPEPLMGVGHIPSDLPGHWRQDPISLIPLALGAKWGKCIPFVVESSSQFRCPVPPAMTSPEYAVAYDEVKRLGGDGVTTPTDRTAEQTYIGIYWGYDGTPNLCAPPRLYNQITTTIAQRMGTSEVELARLLALVNIAMSDATLTAWESKYYYDVWRPITGIRESDPGTGPTGLGDGNPATIGDPTFTPLGAPASNLTGPDFTPPFPAYPSGHASMGGALFQTLRNFYGTDEIPFTFVSDEFNGVTQDNDGTVRPLIPRSFHTLPEAEEENGQSRIYLGIHWSFDKTEGIALGRKVADYVFENSFVPLPPRLR